MKLAMKVHQERRAVTLMPENIHFLNPKLLQLKLS
jgi:hypothetical protein